MNKRSVPTTPGGVGTRTERRKVYRSLLCMDAAGHTDVVDISCGVMLGRARVGTDIFKRENITTRDQMLGFMFGGEMGKRAALSLALYPDATRDNVTPKPEDFVAADFRLLTATVVGANTWKATDFTNEKVLKGSVKLLDRRPVYTDHNTQIANWVGLVTQPAWQEGTTSGGIRVPAGINATLLIDSKTRPEIARGVLLGAINSNSVTVEFEWEMSHKFEKEWDFVDSLGELGSDGKMVRRVVTAITGYHETSLVWLGADPYAKQIDEKGNLINVDKGHIYSKEVAAVKEQYAANRHFALPFGYEQNVVRLARELDKVPPTPNPTLPTMDPKMIAALRLLLGLAADAEITEAHIASLQKADTNSAKKAERFAKLAAIGDAATLKVADMDDAGFDAFATGHTVISNKRLGELSQADLDLKNAKAAGDPIALKRELEGVKTANENLKADAAIGVSYVAEKRKQAVALYKKAVGEKADAAVVGMFEKANDAELNGLLRQYTKEAAAKFSLNCTKCGNADHVEFRSTLSDPEEGGGQKPYVRTAADIADDRRSSSFVAGNQQGTADSK